MLDVKAYLQTARSGTIGLNANHDAHNTSVHHQEIIGSFPGEGLHLHSVSLDTRLDSNPRFLESVRYHVSTVHPTRKDCLTKINKAGTHSHEPIQELLEQRSQVGRHRIVHVLSRGPRANRQDLRDQTRDRRFAVMFQGIQSDSESGSISSHLKVVHETQRAELADVQDCGGGELCVPLGGGDDAVELRTLVSEVLVGI
jgi:hypothetical protein